ncbi:MAG: hypothetical protein H6605_10205 [Flavobacteriales bacterium]|nr:hypothetical protein [Flavobacteriales bacterium]
MQPFIPILFKNLNTLLLLILLLITGSLCIRYLVSPQTDPVCENAVKSQLNPFKVSIDSSEQIWNRAIQYLKKNSAKIGGGKLQVRADQLYIPYYNHYSKGNSIRIDRENYGDSIQITVSWHYSG